MAADVLSSGQERLFRFVEQKFTQRESQKVFEDSKKILGNAPKNSMYEWLCMLQKQGQIKNNNVVLIKDYLAKQSANKEEIEREVDKYMADLTEERSVLTGRDAKIEDITTKLRTDESAVVNLYGASGVGKTTLAKELCHRWNKEESTGRSVKVDLREVKEMKYVYFNILKVLQHDKITMVFEEEAVFKRVRELTTGDKPVLVLLDNSEQFAGGPDKESKVLRTDFLGFLDRLKSPKVDKFKKLRILLTSRNEFTAAKLIEDVHLKPLEDEQSDELLKSAGESNIAEEQKAKVLELCGGRPLLLNTVAAAVKQEGAKLKNLIRKIEEGIASFKGKPVETVKPSGAEKTEGKESEPERVRGEEAEVSSHDSSFLRPLFFNLPSKQLQDAVVSLSLFCHPFSLKASARVLSVEMYEASLLLESLRSYNFIITDPDARELTYDIHPLLKSVVNGIRREEEFKQVFREAETRFSHLFMDWASRLSKVLDKRYVDIQHIFNTERANFELALEITTKRDYLFIPESQYSHVAMAVSLFDAVLPVKTRMKLYRSWAETGEKEGKGEKE